jgi:hypothetical protein
MGERRHGRRRAVHPLAVGIGSKRFGSDRMLLPKVSEKIVDGFQISVTEKDVKRLDGVGFFSMKFYTFERDPELFGSEQPQLSTVGTVEGVKCIENGPVFKKVLPPTVVNCGAAEVL